MAFELPVVTSDLLSAPCYVRHGVEGLLTPPGDVAAVARAIDELRASRRRRTTLGLAGRARVVDCCDLRTNVAGLRALMADARRRLWRDKIDQLMAYRRSYTHGVQDRHDAIRERTVRFFQPRGRTLDIGCGSGKLRAHLPGGTRYVGCDPMLLPTAGREFAAVSASGEQLPFPDGAFDSVVLYDVLSYVLDPDATLSEAVRVLRRDGTLHVRECVDDGNPMHLNHFTQPDLVRRIAEAMPAMTVEREPHTLFVNARRKAARAVTRPLASIAITTYNRRPFLRTCLDSALGQSYQPVEVVVVDDGSTDGSRDVLAQYGGRITAVVCETNGGIARAKNLALRATSPDAAYVAILDSDDYFHPSFIERSVRYLDEHPEVGLVYTDDVLVDANGCTLAERQSVEPWNIDCWLRTCNLRGDSWVARRELVMRTDLHDESLACDVDYDLFYQLLERTSFGHLREALVYNRSHPGQTTRNRLELAKCHAANLITYGYSIEYAYHRARRNPEWLPAIEEGAAIGWLRRQRRLARVIDAKPA
jgi:glycosyltransferase involved in cell wall biosynthesis/SAM-dependent methyltransferase